MVKVAGGWQIRCPNCGRSKPFEKVGRRFGAASCGRRVLAWCTQCGRLRLAVIEPVPEPAVPVVPIPMARPLPPPMPPRPPRPDRLQILARKVERLRNALGAFGAVLTGEAWEKGTHVQRYGLAGEEVVVYLDGRSVEIEGPTDLVRRIVAAADRVDG